MAVKLCFGVRISAAQIAAAMGAKYGSYKFSPCPFCGSTGDGNFCNNCGNDLRKGLAEMGPLEVIELMMRRGVLPRPLVLLPEGDRVCICQVLAASSDGVAEAGRGAEFYQWAPVSDMVREYALALGISAPDSRLFAMEEK